jgi:hypothetical protein
MQQFEDCDCHRCRFYEEKCCRRGHRGRHGRRGHDGLDGIDGIQGETGFQGATGFIRSKWIPRSYRN